MNIDRSTPEATGTFLGMRTVVAICVLAVSLPFLFAPFPPSTDLPQHVAQIRMAHDVLSGRSPELFIAWLAPNNLIYALLGLLSAVLSPVLAARVGLWIVALAWALASLVLAIKRKRSPVLGLLAGVLAFQACLYWGSINFMIGWPVFVAWMHLTGESSQSVQTWRRGVIMAAVAVLLYGAHILWFVMGAAWLIVVGIATRAPLRFWLLRMASTAPGVLLAALWYPKFAETRSMFRTGAEWTTLPWQRLHPIRLSEILMGGQAGPGPAATGGVLALWILVVLVTRWGDLRQHSDRLLLYAAALFALIVMFAPDKYMNAILFAQRWAPCAVALLLVGLPQPRLTLCSGIVILLLGIACTTNCLAWHSFTTEEMTGFQEALDATPSNARVLELDTLHESEIVGGHPFMQMMGYLQAEKGGTLNFSFAEHGSSLVSYKSPRELEWTPGLEWYSERVKKEDLRHFDVVLMNAKPEVHQWFSSAVPVTPRTTTGRWRLYAVR